MTKKKFLRLENSPPPPPHNFCNGPSLISHFRQVVNRRRLIFLLLKWIYSLRIILQVPVVERADNAILWINFNPADNAIVPPHTYPLDSELSGGQPYPTFEQPGPQKIANICKRWNYSESYQRESTFLVTLSLLSPLPSPSLLSSLSSRWTGELDAYLPHSSRFFLLLIVGSRLP